MSLIKDLIVEYLRYSRGRNHCCDLDTFHQLESETMRLPKRSHQLIEKQHGRMIFSNNVYDNIKRREVKVKKHGYAGRALNLQESNVRTVKRHIEDALNYVPSSYSADLLSNDDVQDLSKKLEERVKKEKLVSFANDNDGDDLAEEIKETEFFKNYVQKKVSMKKFLEQEGLVDQVMTIVRKGVDVKEATVTIDVDDRTKIKTTEELVEPVKETLKENNNDLTGVIKDAKEGRFQVDLSEVVLKPVKHVPKVKEKTEVEKVLEGLKPTPQRKPYIEKESEFQSMIKKAYKDIVVKENEKTDDVEVIKDLTPTLTPALKRKRYDDEEEKPRKKARRDSNKTEAVEVIKDLTPKTPAPKPNRRLDEDFDEADRIKGVEKMENKRVSIVKKDVDVETTEPQIVKSQVVMKPQEVKSQMSKTPAPKPNRRLDDETIKKLEEDFDVRDPGDRIERGEDFLRRVLSLYKKDIDATMLIRLALGEPAGSSNIKSVEYIPLALKVLDEKPGEVKNYLSYALVDKVVSATKRKEVDKIIWDYLKREIVIVEQPGVEMPK